MILMKWMISDANEVRTAGPENLLAIPPEPVLVDLYKNNQGFMHYKCPAFINALANTYVIRAAFDFDIVVDHDLRKISTSKDSFLKLYLHNRTHQNDQICDMIISLSFFYLFLTDEEDVELEMLPAVYHRSDLIDKLQLIMGKFVVSKWARGIEFSGIIKDSKPEGKQLATTINIKRGDPLCYVRFNTKNNEKIKLVQEKDFDKITHYSKTAHNVARVKSTYENMKLEDCYKLYSNFRKPVFSLWQKLFAKVNKCPFKHK
jgi:hypothetical protein